MDRAHKFMAETREEALAMMSKGLHNMHPRELDVIIALCNAHNETCEFVELVEKFDSHSGDSKKSYFGGR